MDETRSFPPHLYRACEAVGQVVELWGFKRIHGMIWMYIFLQAQPVSAKEIKDGLGISSGLVSMSLADLQHWDVVHRHSLPGERRDYYSAEANIGKPILKVLREREYYQIGVLIDTLREIRGQIDAESSDEAFYAARQLELLIHLGELGQSLFGQFLELAGLVMRGIPQMNLAAETGQVLLKLRKFLSREREGQAP